MRVARTETIMRDALALYTGQLFALDAGADISLDIPQSNKDVASSICAVCRIRCRKLFRLKIELLDVILR
jgi:hypothetical protein